MRDILGRNSYLAYIRERGVYPYLVVLRKVAVAWVEVAWIAQIVFQERIWRL